MFKNAYVNAVMVGAGAAVVIVAINFVLGWRK